MEKTYDPHSIEKTCYQKWEQDGRFAAGKHVANDNTNAYCIMIPPPNVTGSLHMGHAFQHTIMDALTRYQRMLGADTLWQPGSDHAGIATQMVVERLLAKESVSRHDIGREKFVEKVWEWKDQSGGKISQQMRRLGDSCDWQREAFTMSPELSEAVTEVFVRLHEEGLIYRGQRLVNWDPVLQTAISGLEVETREVQGSMWQFAYPLDAGPVDGISEIVIATTRPETMLGDGAVAVHPSDERYKNLIGKMVRLPIAERLIPIIADEYPDPEFGSGAVKITGAHDQNDFEVAQRNNIPLIKLMDGQARMISNAENQVPDRYHGKDRYVARKMVLAEIEELGLYRGKEDKLIAQPYGDRSGVVIEPMLTNQWYVKVGPLAEPAIKAVEDGEIKFVPENWSNTYFHWMRNIQDWCISRQLWWGHQIPAWYDESDNIYVGRTETEVRAKYDLGNAVLRRDADVLDTWFSSALWPFATLGWPKQTPELDTYLPTNVLVTGFDIIFFWVARMIMMGLKFTGKVPFKEIYITGLIKDEHGQKMSKSKGNVLDPIDLIDGIDLETLVEKRTSGMMQPKMAKKVEKATRKQFSDGIQSYGTDALRFTFAALASTSRDINFDLARVEGYRNFCNKIWNASRYVLMNTAEHDCSEQGAEYSITDQWIQSRLNTTVANVHKHFANYRFDLAAMDLYDFTWNEFCDWYLELSKPVLYSDEISAARKQGTRHTLLTVLESLLRLLHPITPFITESIWQSVAPLALSEHSPEASIMVQAYPQFKQSLVNNEAEKHIEWIKEFVLGIRQIRGENDIAPSRALPVLVSNATQSDMQRIEEFRTLLSKIAKIASIEILTDESGVPPSATALLGQMKLYVPLAGLIDAKAEIERLGKRLVKAQNNQQSLTKKLANEKFVNSAPEAVVAKERNKLKDSEQECTQLKQQIEKMQALV
ncbi:MAG: valine--tRNA ligase [Gammaproteobacteria bacterium]|nr:valine--tRNA ligase [Gammaproteobacteria bacterium]NNC96759.1 valine--tRNA ligase [Gammaproteobacteria bacterium]NNM13511.1 valine--tRNA ligase [Gammaproteobacteria bacterium]